MNAPATVTNKGSIFVVEDSEEIRDLIKFLFESEGYKVGFAGDGREALDKLRQSPELPRVILLDLMMPGMDGLQFRAEQEKDPRLSSIPVLIMTADSSPEIKAKSVNANGYIKKPVAVDTLLQVAEKFCS